MALRAGYIGLKRFEKNKLSILAASMPADISPDNPIAGKNDVLASIGLLSDTVGWTGKNKLINNAENGTRGTITITHNANETITLSAGQMAESASAYTVNTSQSLPKGKYYLVGGYGDSNFYLKLQNTTIADTTGKGVPFELENDGIVDVRLYMTAGAELSESKTFSPMIVDADVYELLTTYEPYHESVEDIIGKLDKNIIEMGGNGTTFNVPFKRLSNSAYTIGLITIASGLYHFFLRGEDELNAVTLTKVFDNNSTRTMSVSYSNDTLVITLTETLYGGVLVETNNLNKLQPTLTQALHPAVGLEYTADIFKGDKPMKPKKATKKKVIKEEEE